MLYPNGHQLGQMPEKLVKEKFSLERYLDETEKLLKETSEKVRGVQQW